MQPEAPSCRQRMQCLSVAWGPLELMNDLHRACCRDVFGDAVGYPTSGTVFDYYVDLKGTRGSDLRSWSDSMPSFQYDKRKPYFGMLVPTLDTVRYSFLLEVVNCSLLRLAGWAPSLAACCKRRAPLLAQGAHAVCLVQSGLVGCAMVGSATPSGCSCCLFAPALPAELGTSVQWHATSCIWHLNPQQSRHLGVCVGSEQRLDAVGVSGLP